MTQFRKDVSIVALSICFEPHLNLLVLPLRSLARVLDAEDRSDLKSLADDKLLLSRKVDDDAEDPEGGSSDKTEVVDRRLVS